ncbi:M16 family metallopeptidase [Clostridium magnum]|uniref:Peptidase M16 inactive domain protein n=1 Tax=Clostridium magnum DSM 2767 TaxID=1121326 RepID=A0A162UKY1_9CLOT|nr:pitrilysin family protein [Clostridium magnum]KZL94030.1 peptidase M16 inactive domain protein [Clostridium magnum DSM 2767]SHI00683.1 Predicted Zn-dependent peptidase [Clostridium magnum DSM 2767]
MKKYILNNRVKLIYEFRSSDITSFCIGFNAGALEEVYGFKMGTAHAVEHMVSKGTKTRSEEQINKLCDKIFGFENAMTNFPYVVYYGTSLSEDFERGLELYSDIILNPIFPEEGFKEEMDIIMEEWKEWSDDIYQHCEDSLLYNSFNKKRIKNLIIGELDSIKEITLKDIKEFYKRYYSPENCVISICSFLPFDEVLAIVKRYFEKWNKEFKGITREVKETNNPGIFTEKVLNIKGAKIQYLFNIDHLEEDEFKALTLFNSAFGEGTSGMLYEEIRTKNALAYDLGSLIKNERGIKFFTINMGTSVENIEKALAITNNKIEEIKKSSGYFNEEKIRDLSKSIKLKRQLKLEKSIQLCKELTTYELMYGSAEKVYEEVENLEYIGEQKILEVINKVLKNPTIQVLTN